MATRINVYDYAPVEWGEKPTRAGHFTEESATQYKENGVWDDTATHQELYRTKGGRWVRCDWTQYQGSEAKYWFIDDADAKEWLLKNDQDDAVTRWLAWEVPDEEGPNLGGRPGVGPKVEVRLPPEELAQVDAYAEQDGVKRAEELRRLVSLGLAARQ